MARPRAVEEGDVLDKAAEVFRRKGFDGASLPDLEKATGLCRASLYGAFQDKRYLYLAALRRYDSARGRRVGDGGVGQQAAVRVRALLDHALEQGLQGALSRLLRVEARGQGRGAQKT